MNNKQNVGISSKPCVQQKGHGWRNFACIHKVVSISSVLCTFVGMSLFSAIFFGPADILDYRNIKLIYECAHYAVVAAVVLCFLAFLLSFFKEDSKRNAQIVAPQKDDRGLVQLANNQIANLRTDKSLMTDKSKLAESCNNVKQPTVIQNIEPKNTTLLKLGEVTKKPEIKSGNSTSNSPLENQYANPPKNIENSNSLPTNTSFKIAQQVSKSKSEVNTKILPSNIQSKTLQHSSTSKQNENGSILSPIISSSALQQSNTNTPNNKLVAVSDKPQSQTSYEKPFRTDQQLVLYEKHSKSPFYGRTMQKTPYQSPNLYECMPTNLPVYSPVTEITATKRMTVSPWGVAQEEYKVSQRTFYHISRSPVGRISPQYGFRPTFNYDTNGAGIQDYGINQARFYQQPPHPRGRSFSFSEPSPKFDNLNGTSPMFNQPNKVKDVLEKFETMNIFH